MKRRTDISTICTLLLALLLMAPQAGLAQQAKPSEPVTPSDEQQKINDKGVEHLIEENYARTVAHFEQSLLLGELNVTYLNLGRAYQRLGKCTHAKQALNRGLVGPSYDGPLLNFSSTPAVPTRAHRQRGAGTPARARWSPARAGH